MPRFFLLLLFLASVGAGTAGGQGDDPPIFELTLGSSTDGRPITALRVGTGAHKLVLVGGVHGRPEANTSELVAQLANYFRDHPDEVRSGLSLYLIPTLNPDGLAVGSRLNARGVDLNRNMDTSADACPENDWQPVVAGAYGLTAETGGSYPESEVESRLIRDFLLDAHGVVFFHSNAGVVFPACAHDPSTLMAQVFADSSGYQFTPTWQPYVITGGMHDWAGGLGIAAITPELITGYAPEFDQNLAGVQALLGTAEGLLPDFGERSVDGVAVDPVIWRAWRAWGAERLWGRPIQPPQPDGHGGSTQLFENGLLEYRPEQTATPYVVQVALLGREWLGERVVPAHEPSGRYFAETGHSVDGLFLRFWQIYGGTTIFGLPLTPEEPALDEAGRPVVIQTFERGQLMRPQDATTFDDVRLWPLGRLRWAQADARNPETSIRTR